MLKASGSAYTVMNSDSPGEVSRFAVGAQIAQRARGYVSQAISSGLGLRSGDVGGSFWKSCVQILAPELSISFFLRIRLRCQEKVLGEQQTRN